MRGGPEYGRRTILTHFGMSVRLFASMDDKGLSAMPTLSLFFGIVIRMYREIGAKHSRPHVHAVYQGFEAPFDIETGEILAQAEFPDKQATLVRSWLIIHREDLLANWNLLQTDGTFFKIEPLR